VPMRQTHAGADGPSRTPAAFEVARVLGHGPARLGLRGTCVVEKVVRTTTEAGFTYRTEPGHAEDGTETFRVDLAPDGTVRGTVTALSAPVHPVLRSVPRLGRLGQRWIAHRYLAALRRVARSA